MTNIVSQPIKPFVTEEGIELYATETECGMSQRGLSLFCGVSSDSVFKLISNLTDRQNVPEILQPFVGQELTLSANFEKSAKVYKSNLCAAVCTYYAYISKAANETARFSLGKFASMGIVSSDCGLSSLSKTKPPLFLIQRRFTIPIQDVKKSYYELDADTFRYADLV